MRRHELENQRIGVLLDFVSACARIQEFDSILRLLTQRAHSLLDFERLSILLCNQNHEILRTIVISNHASREVSSGNLHTSEMDLIRESLVTATLAAGRDGICMPMISAGCMFGVLSISKSETFSDSDIRIVEFLAGNLAGTFDRLEQIHTMQLNPTTQAESRRMAYIAQHDALTGLPNRWLLNERLDRVLALSSRHGRRLAILFLDVDGFKKINDSLGHGVGDQALRQISDRLLRCVRASDTVSRIGGDEFVILLSEFEDEKDAMKCAGKLIAAVQEPVSLEGHELRLTVSVGISLYPGDGEDAETLIRNADTAMYRAKAKGPGNSHRFRQDAIVVAAAAKASVS